MDAFAQLLRTLVVEFGGDKQDLAKAVKVNRSTFSRLLNGRTKASPELCLRLAHVTGANPSKVLAAASHSALARLLETLCGAPVTRKQSSLTPLDAKHLLLIRTLRNHERRALVVIASTLHTGGGGQKLQRHSA